MNYKEFVALVIELRNAQKKYFSSRSLKDLKEAKCLEAKVDKIAAEVLRGFNADGSEQLSFNFEI